MIIHKLKLMGTLNINNDMRHVTVYFVVLKYKKANFHFHFSKLFQVEEYITSRMSSLTIRMTQRLKIIGYEIMHL